MKMRLLMLMLLLVSPLSQAEVAANKTLVRGVFQALETGDLDAINRAFDPVGTSIVGTQTRPRGGPHKTFAEAAPFPAALDERKVNIEDLFGEGDRIAVRSEICGTHARPLAGFAPTGKRVCARYLNVYTIEKGKIVVNAVGMDRLQLRQLLEANAKPAETAENAAKE